MATATGPHRLAVREDPAYQAYLILRTGFVVAPILFGLDKFTNLLTDWTAYLAPAVDRLIPGTATTAMVAVGVIEIVAGLVVAVRPRWPWPGWPPPSGALGPRLPRAERVRRCPPPDGRTHAAWPPPARPGPGRRAAAGHAAAGRRQLR